MVKMDVTPVVLSTSTLPSKRPYKKRKRSSATKPYDSSAGGSGKSISIPKGCGIFNGIGIPRCLFCKLSYTERLTLNSNTTTLALHQFRLNSTFDPDVTGTGTQPYGRDQVAGMYGRYIVYGCTVRAIFANGGTNGPTMCTIRATVDGTAPTDIDAEGDRINGKAIMISPGESKIMNAYYPIHTMIGETKAQYAGNIYNSAAIGSNPVKVCYLNVCTQNLVGSTDTTCQVRLIYHCKFFDESDVTPS